MIVVIGAGLVGSAVIHDLSEDFTVTAFDKSRAALSAVPAAKKYTDDIFDRQKLLKDAEVIVTTLPGSVSFKVVTKLLRMGKNVVDTSFMAEDPFELDKVAKKSGSIFIPDAGYAPGITNVLSGRLFKKEAVNAIEIVVGGLPLQWTEPFRHAVTFNVEGLIDEYTRPARIVRNGRLEEIDPLSDISKLSFPGQGEFDAFYSDGLRTLLRTIKVKGIYEKTLRYPGHLQYMKLLRDFGYFSPDPIDGMVPRAVTERLFGSYSTDFRDKCLTRVIGLGERRYVYSNVDRYNQKTRTKSMARMTGYAAASMARVLLDGGIDAAGVYPPEYMGFFDNQFSAFMSYLRKKGIRFDYSEE